MVHQMSAVIKDPKSTLFNTAYPPIIYGQVIPRVLMLIGVEPLNRILVVVWYVITMVTITLKYCH